MAKFRNISDELRFVFHGLSTTRAVPAGDVLDVPDEAASAYAGQPNIWEQAQTAPAQAVETPKEG